MRLLRQDGEDGGGAAELRVLQALLHLLQQQDVQTGRLGATQGSMLLRQDQHPLQGSDHEGERAEQNYIP